jgi:hypothetical protein
MFVQQLKQRLSECRKDSPFATNHRSPSSHVLSTPSTDHFSLRQPKWAKDHHWRAMPLYMVAISTPLLFLAKSLLFGSLDFILHTIRCPAITLQTLDSKTPGDPPSPFEQNTWRPQVLTLGSDRFGRRVVCSMKSREPNSKLLAKKSNGVDIATMYSGIALQ